MDDTDQRDPVTGLLHRQAFLHEVHETHRLMPQRLRRGCLLILYFPILQSLLEHDEKDEVAEDALRHLLAIVQTRVRSRDTIGRISKHSLCILLKGCAEADAVIVADQYAALLRDIVVEVEGQPHSMNLRYRIVPLDAQGTKTRQGVSRLIVAPPVRDHAMLSKQIDIAGNRVDLSTSKVVSLNALRHERQVAHEGEQTSEAAKGTVLEIGARDSAQSWRLRPGMLVLRKPLTCCFRLQAVGIVRMVDSLQQTDLFSSVLKSLALSDDASRPILESQLILPVHARQLNEQFPEWVSARCKQMRVAPSDICLSISIDSLSQELRTVAPVLRLLNRHGIRLMLEGVASSSQFRMMKNIATFDYLHISGRSLNDSLTQLTVRLELEAIISDAKALHCEICSGGIDSEAMMNHALAMQVEIGFGRYCGASVAFPESGWMKWEELQG